MSSKSRYSVLIIGVGSIGERHLRCFQATGQAEVAACEPNAELGKTIAEKYNCKAYTSLEEAFAKGSFDMAVICSPANSHIPISIQCINRGLHVLCEKPLAITIDGIGELEKVIKEKNRVFRVAYTHRSIAANLMAKELLDSGKIGAPRHIVASVGQHFPSFRPAYRNIYYARHETGGGAIQDALTHMFNLVEWLVSPIESVFAHADHMVLEGVDVEDTVNLVARLRDGTLAAFLINQFQPVPEVFVMLNGTKGSIRSEIHASRTGITLLGDKNWTWHDTTEERDNYYIRQAQFFIDAVEGKKDGLATLEDGVQTLKVNRAALESAKTHKEVQIA